jgi:hypothetical protein
LREWKDWSEERKRRELVRKEWGLQPDQREERELEHGSKQEIQFVD